MAAITIRDLDESVEKALRLRAARSGRPVEEELKRVLTSALQAEERTRTGAGPAAGESQDSEAAPDESPATGKGRGKRPRTPAEREKLRRAILALGRKPDEPFDQKKITDELWDFVD